MPVCEKNSIQGWFGDFTALEAIQAANMILNAT